MVWRNRDVKESKIIHIAIECGACNVISNHIGSMDIDAGHCTCSPETYTCMCFTGKRLNFQCPRTECRYTGEIELY